MYNGSRLHAKDIGKIVDIIHAIFGRNIVIICVNLYQDHHRLVSSDRAPPGELIRHRNPNVSQAATTPMSLSSVCKPIPQDRGD